MISLIITEILLLSIFCLSEFFVMRYKDLNYASKLLWRIVLWLPLILTILQNTIYNMSLYDIGCLIIFMVVMIADAIIIDYFLIGLGLFLLVHIGNGIMMTIAFGSFSFISYFILTGILIVNLFIFLKYFLNANLDPIFGALFKIILFIYLLGLSWSLWRGFSLFMSNDIQLAITASIGVLFFYLCDLQISFIDVLNSDKELTKFDQILNHIFYYIGITSIALTTYFI